MSIPLAIVYDPLGLYQCGTQFERQKFATTLWMACWPVGLVVRDTVDNRRYEVIEYESILPNGTPNPHQYLLALGRDVELRASRNGNLKRKVHNEDPMPQVQARVPAAGGPGAGGKRDRHGDVPQVRHTVAGNAAVREVGGVTTAAPAAGTGTGTAQNVKVGSAINCLTNRSPSVII